MYWFFCDRDSTRPFYGILSNPHICQKQKLVARTNLQKSANEESKNSIAEISFAK